MINLIEEIYAKLAAIAPDTFFHLLPENQNPDGTLIVYELNESGTLATLDKDNYASEIEIVVKILNPSAKALIGIGEQVKAAFKDPFQYNRSISYRNSVPVFQDRELGTLQYTLIFNAYYDSTVKQIINLFLNLSFAAGASGVQTITITADEAGEYTKHVLSNITGATYKKNTLAVSFPFSVVEGDSLEVSATITDAALSAKLTMEGQQ